MLPEIDTPAAANQAAEKIRARLEAPYMIEGDQIQITISIGIANFRSAGQPWCEILKQADAAMYSSKRRRRGAARDVK
jgi:diguanylate cyclase (GGDEF)-like protein